MTGTKRPRSERIESTSSRTITFDPAFNKSQYVLLELSDELLAYVEESDDPQLCFKGVDGSDAVFCTESSTFAVKRVETSNCQLLLPSNSDSVFGMTNYQLELSISKGLVESLGQILQRSPTGLTVDQLMENVQASEQEIVNELSRLCATESSGRWFLATDETIENVFADFLMRCVEEDWRLDKIPVQECLDFLRDYSSKAIHQCLRQHTADHKMQTVAYALDPTLVALSAAKPLLRAKKRIEKEAFIEEWSLQLPQGADASLEYLKGLILHEREGPHHILVYFPASQLSTEPRTRFQQLFKAREKWKLEELVPYIMDLTGPGVSQASLLLKYTRSSFVNGSSGDRLYSKR